MRTLFLLIIFALPAHAQVAECNPNQPQTFLIECQTERYRTWDRLLNEIYQRVITTLDAGTEENLRQAQRAWITFRDLTCGMEAGRYEGGSIAPLIEVTCLTRLTERRTRDLEEYMRP